MKWVGGDTLNLAIGQGDLTVSPLQMANMVALVANGGTIYKPHLLKETRDPVSGAVIDRVAARGAAHLADEHGDVDLRPGGACGA